MKIFFIILSSFMISSSESLTFTKLNEEALRVEISKLVNEIRTSKKLKKLAFNDTLRKAAQHHSDYIAKYDKLTHYERGINYRTPKDRVKTYGGSEFGTVGENVLFTTLDYSSYTQKEIQLLAQEAIDLWKASPGHYRTMIYKELSYADIGIAIHYPKNRIYITQVFGEK